MGRAHSFRPLASPSPMMGRGKLANKVSLMRVGVTA